MHEATRRPRFAACIRNEGCEDLELRKLYPVLPDESAAREGFLRIIDESGEDYLYPADHFVAVELPERVEETLAAISAADLTGTSQPAR